MTQLNPEDIRRVDRHDMLGLIQSMPGQLLEADEIAGAKPIEVDRGRIRTVCICGMGGSAIGGDIARCLNSESSRVPLIVNRYYSLPAAVDANTLVVVSSYSGNTEETLSAFGEAEERGAQIVCITSGGQLATAARSQNHPVITIPGGNPPRSALGYLTVVLLRVLHQAGLIPDPQPDIRGTAKLLEQLVTAYNPDKSENLAKKIARQLQDKIPLILASVHRWEAVAMRWKGQLCENSKMLAFANVYPELNHNEIMGWGPLATLNRNFQIVHLMDKHDHPKIKQRMEISAEIYARHQVEVTPVTTEGRSLLERTFSLLYLGDMVSLYRAVLNQVDPTAIANIDYLKQQLRG